MGPQWASTSRRSAVSGVRCSHPPARLSHPHVSCAHAGGSQKETQPRLQPFWPLRPDPRWAQLRSRRDVWPQVRQPTDQVQKGQEPGQCGGQVLHLTRARQAGAARPAEGLAQRASYTC